MDLAEARRRLRAAVVKLAQAERARLEVRDVLAYRRLLISVGYWRKKVKTLEQAPQRELFHAY